MLIHNYFVKILLIIDLAEVKTLLGYQLTA